MSEAINSPRGERNARAMRGYWHHFPVSPEKYADGVQSQYAPSRWYSKNRTFSLERRLSAYVEKQEVAASLADLFALYRAFVPVVTEKMRLVDDSYGVIGTLCQQVFERLVKLDRATLDMPLEILFQDLIEFMLWEDYAATDPGDLIFSLAFLNPRFRLSSVSSRSSGTSCATWSWATMRRKR